MKYTVWVWREELEEWRDISFLPGSWEECVDVAADHLKEAGPLARVQLRPEVASEDFHKVTPNIATLNPTQRLRDYPYTVPALRELERAEAS